MNINDTTRKLVVSKKAVETELIRLHKELRNDINLISIVATVINILTNLNILTKTEEELWIRRIDTCPGHNDEGGRDWCAYCGLQKNRGNPYVSIRILANPYL